MTSESRPVHPEPPATTLRFVPSRDLARKALEASAAATAPPAPHAAMEVRHAGEPFSLIPLASEPQTYGAANVPLPAERLDLAPHTPPAAFAPNNAVPGPAAVAAAAAPSGELAASSDAVERTQAAIGVRVERMLATLAFRAAAAGQSELRLSDRERFTPHVSQELLSRLPINLHAATPILDGLLAELRQLAQGSGLSADWGRLVERPEGLFLELKPFQRDTESRARARVLPPGSNG